MMHSRSVCACILPSHTCTHPASIHVCRSLLPSYYTRLVHARTPSGITRRPVKTTATRCRPSTALSAARQRPSVPPVNGPQCRPPTALSAARQRPSVPPAIGPQRRLLTYHFLYYLQFYVHFPPRPRRHLPTTCRPRANRRPRCQCRSHRAAPADHAWSKCLCSLAGYNFPIQNKSDCKQIRLKIRFYPLTKFAYKHMPANQLQI